MSARSRISASLRRFAKVVLGNYSAYFIYRSPPADSISEQIVSQNGKVRRVSLDELANCEHANIRDEVHYAGSQSDAFAFIENGSILGLCFYWHGDRYKQRNFWPLQDNEAKLVQLMTLPAARGRGVATELIRQSLPEMAAQGIVHAFARIWHSNAPSYRAFERAGWTRIAFVAEINPPWMSKPARWTFRLSGKGGASGRA